MKRGAPRARAAFLAKGGGRRNAPDTLGVAEPVFKLDDRCAICRRPRLSVVCGCFSCFEEDRRFVGLFHHFPSVEESGRINDIYSLLLFGFHRSDQVERIGVGQRERGDGGKGDTSDQSMTLFHLSLLFGSEYQQLTPDHSSAGLMAGIVALRMTEVRDP